MYADTVSELLSAVIPGYDELPSNETATKQRSWLATRRRSSWPTWCRPGW